MRFSAILLLLAVGIKKLRRWSTHRHKVWAKFREKLLAALKVEMVTCGERAEIIVIVVTDASVVTTSQVHAFCHILSRV